MELKITSEVLISLVSLAFSIYAYATSVRTNKKIAIQQLQINKFNIEKEEQLKKENNQANLYIYSIKTRNHGELIIRNNRKAEAREVNIKLPEECEKYFMDTNEIFPIDLVSGGTTKIIYSRTMDFPSKYEVSVFWKDNSQTESQEKKVTITE